MISSSSNLKEAFVFQVEWFDKILINNLRNYHENLIFYIKVFDCLSFTGYLDNILTEKYITLNIWSFTLRNVMTYIVNLQIIKSGRYEYMEIIQFLCTDFSDLSLLTESYLPMGKFDCFEFRGII